MRQRGILVIASLVAFVMLAACTGAIQETREPVYIPPTPLPTATQPPVTVQPTVEVVIKNSPTPGCTNNLTFLDDLTIPDGTIVEPGESLDKRWLLQNSGSCNWNADYEVRLIAGAAMEAQTPRRLYPAVSGAEFVLQMTFIAPQEPSIYRSAWQAFDTQGNPFGDPFYIEIVVGSE